MIKLTDQEFKDLYTFVKSNYGINLEKKRQLIESRMNSVLADKGFKNYTDYLKFVNSNPNEITVVLNKLTTNHTYFLREPEHFDFLTKTILPEIKVTNDATKEMRIWSAGCSTGEEAYTTIMTLKDFFGMDRWDYRILATDISTHVMESAKVGVYSPESIANIPKAWEKYFKKTPDDLYLLSDEIKREVIFRKLNLMDSFSFKKPFDLIFCRNVMIYFDQPTKDKLVNKYYDVLKPGGYLFIGHSETISRNATKFEYVQPSIYRKGK
ncbi:MAG: protein-glutamate O-methyltransferase [Clostridiales bacterium]|nr:protein-glutamate O-methyltransferase [Clostridiales bacterium]